MLTLHAKKLLLLLMLATNALMLSITADDTLVGEVKGEVLVTQGALNWKTPIEVPAGPNGIQPGIVISYAQNTGNGLLGLNFSITGLGSVQRCAKTKKIDGLVTNAAVQYNQEDRFCLDGMRLIEIDSSSMGTEYRKHSNDMAKIVAHGSYNSNPDSFTVYAKDGYIYTYGSSDDARIDSLDHSDYTDQWLLKTITDRFDNQVTIEYFNGSDTIKPKNIHWSKYTLLFDYEAREHTVSAYKKGVRQTLKQRLAGLTLLSNNVELKTYQLGYEVPENQSYERLSSIKLCIGERCTPPTRLTWKDGHEGYVKEKLKHANIYPHNVNNLAKLSPDQLDPSECKIDEAKVVCLGYEDSEVHEGLTTHKKVGSSKSRARHNLERGFMSATLQFVDLNKDGYRDYCIQLSSSMICGLNTQQNSFHTAATWHHSLGYKDSMRFTDFNLDGYIDVCKITAAKGFECNLNQQGQSFSDNKIPLSSQLSSFANKTSSSPLGWRMMNDYSHYSSVSFKTHKQVNNSVGFVDINNDGFADFCGADESGLSCYINTAEVDVQGADYLPVFNQKKTLINDIGFHSSKWTYTYQYLYEEYWSEGGVDIKEWRTRSQQLDSASQAKSFAYHDVNIDGNVDLCAFSREGDYQCAINTGDGFKPPKVWLSKADLKLAIDSDAFNKFKAKHTKHLISDSVKATPLMEFLARHMVVTDVTGDGRADVIIRSIEKNDENNKDPILFDPIIFKNTGHGFELADETADEMAGDFTELSSIVTAFGNRVDIESAFVSSDKLLYVKDHTQLNDNSLNITPYTQRLIKSVSYTEGKSNNNNTISYQYHGSRVDLDEGSLGFAKVTKHNAQEKTLTTEHYHQTQDFLGTLKSIEKHYTGLASVDEYYQAAKYGNTNNTLLMSSQNTYQLLEQEGYKIIRTIAVDERDYSEDGRIKVATSTQYLAFDDHENPTETKLTKRSELTNEVHTVSTETAFKSADDDRWLIDKPALVTTTHSNTLADERIVRAVAYSYYDNGALKTETISPNQAKSLKTEYTYDAFGNTETVTVSRDGDETTARTTTTKYSDDGLHALQKINPMQHQQTLVYKPGNVCDKPDEMIDANKLVTQWQYNDLCAIEKELRADGTWTTTEVSWATDEDLQGSSFAENNAVFKVVTHTAGMPSQTEWFDSQSRSIRTLKASINGDSLLSDKIYNARGQVVLASLPYKSGEYPEQDRHFVRSYYDHLGRLKYTQKPSEDGYITERCEYDGFDTTYYNGKDQAKTRSKNLQNKLAKVTEHGDESTISYRYDAVGNLLSTNTNGHIISMEYDHLNNKKRMTDPDMGTWQYHYNGFGELEWQIDAKGQKTINRHDALGRVYWQNNKDGTATWTYDRRKNGVGQLGWKIARDRSTISNYYYDKYGRLYQENKRIDGQWHKTRMYFDEYSRLIKTQHPTGFEEIRSYTPEGYLKNIKTKKSNVEDYDTQQYKKSLALLEEKIEALSLLESQRGEKYFMLLRKAEAYKVTAIEYQKKAQMVRDSNGKASAALVRAADRLTASISTLQSQAEVHQSQAERYRKLREVIEKRLASYDGKQYSTCATTVGCTNMGRDMHISKTYLRMIKDYEARYAAATKELSEDQLALAKVEQAFEEGLNQSHHFSAQTRAYAIRYLNWLIQMQENQLKRDLSSIDGKLRSAHYRKTYFENYIKGNGRYKSHYQKLIAKAEVEIKELEPKRAAIKQAGEAKLSELRALKSNPNLDSEKVGVHYGLDRKSESYQKRAKKMEAEAKALVDSDNAAFENKIAYYDKKLTELDVPYSFIKKSQRIRYKGYIESAQNYQNYLDRYGKYSNESGIASYKKKIAYYLKRAADIKRRYGTSTEVARARYLREIEQYKAKLAVSQSRTEQSLVDLKELRIKKAAYEHTRDQIKNNLAEFNSDPDEVLLWQATDRDAQGRVMAEIAGNGLVTTRFYDYYTGRLKTITTGLDENKLLRDFKYEYDNNNNVILRVENAAGYSDSFTYDHADRLETFNHSGIAGKQGFDRQYSYDINGNIELKTGVASMQYDNGNNQISSLSRDDGTVKTYSYDANGNIKALSDSQGNQSMRIEWTSFNKPKRIDKGESYSEFKYDADDNRVQQINRAPYQQIVQDGIEKTLYANTTTHYISKSYQKVAYGEGARANQVEHKYHIYAEGRLVATHIETEQAGVKQPNQMLYMHTDNLGSIDTITNNLGQVVKQSRYDPFGQAHVIKQVSDQKRAKVNKGFTGHEHLAGLNLIHMNARIYDQEVGRFLSADTYIQSPDVTDSYNRYAYTWNNPLKYTDPSGHFLKGLFKSIMKHIGTIMGLMLSYGLKIALMAVPGGMFLAAGIGTSFGALASGADLATALQAGVFAAISAGVANYIGHGGVNGGSLFKTTVGRHLAHATSQGVITELKGGKFKDGFVGSIGGAMLGGFVAKHTAAMFNSAKAHAYFVRASVGGLMAKATGGKFADGAISAAMVYLFNDLESLLNKARSMVKSFGRKYNPRSIAIDREVGGYIYQKDGKLYSSKVFVGDKSGLTIKYVEAKRLGRDVLVDWHTHGSPSTASNVFSPTDIVNANGLRAHFSSFSGSYLFTPANDMLYYQSGSVPTWLVTPYQRLEDVVGGDTIIARDFRGIGEAVGF